MPGHLALLHQVGAIVGIIPRALGQAWGLSGLLQELQLGAAMVLMLPVQRKGRGRVAWAFSHGPAARGSNRAGPPQKVALAQPVPHLKEPAPLLPRLYPLGHGFQA